MKRCQDVYNEPVILHLDNCIARVYSPILTDEEQERRMERIKKAAADLIMSAERSKNKLQDK